MQKLLFILIISIIFISITTYADAQQIPDWVKNSAKWWSLTQISDHEFTRGLEFLIHEEIIQIPKNIQSKGQDEQGIPSWLRNNAGWWSQGLISDEEFLRSIQYLINVGIVSVNFDSDKTIQSNLMIGSFDISKAGPIEGDKDASMTIIMFSDYQCERCAKWFLHEKQEVTEKYIKTGKVNFVVLDYPMLGDDSVSAAEANYCAHDQGKYFEYHNYLYTKHRGVQNGWANQESLVKYSDDLGMDSEQFDNCLLWDRHSLRVAHNKMVGASHGVVSTPIFFIVNHDGNFERITGSQPPVIFDRVIKGFG
ncbi:MAG: DsbA family protein [Candidatus Nitrosopumilus sp. bin_32a]